MLLAASSWAKMPLNAVAAAFCIMLLAYKKYLGVHAYIMPQPWAGSSSGAGRGAGTNGLGSTQAGGKQRCGVTQFFPLAAVNLQALQLCG